MAPKTFKAHIQIYKLSYKQKQYKYYTKIKLTNTYHTITKIEPKKTNNQ
jgi:hypothetical protein